MPMDDRLKSLDELRRDAAACLRAAVGAVEPALLVRRFLSHDPEARRAGRVHLLAVGKAAAGMARGAREVLGDGFAHGVAILPATAAADARLAGLEVFHGGHPVPDEEGVEGARAILRMAADLTGSDLLLCLISGGGSALMTLPPAGVSLDDVRETTAGLLRAGADIQELNCLRKHLDRLKGGRLAEAAHPSRVLALVLSDVVGDPLDVIASGPVSPDPSTFEDGIRILRRYGLWESTPAPVRDHLERGRRGEIPDSPGGAHPCFSRTRAVVIGNNRTAADAARAEAEARGCRAFVLTSRLTGEAREVGRVLGALGRALRRRPPASPLCLIAGGETTVTVRGRGRGGRNQELALGAALALGGSPNVLVASFGTDGVDGPTDAAGAVASGETLKRAASLGLDAEKALAENDTYAFWRALGDLIVTGPTGTNVMDLVLVLTA